MNTRFLILLLALSLTGCNPPGDSAATVADSATTSDTQAADAAATAEGNGFSSSIDSTTAEPTVADTDSETNQNSDDWDDSNVNKAENNTFYTKHDAYHHVTCWYIYSQTGGVAISCLPDSQIVNQKN